jgi:UDP-N-acetyl-D-mannosaminuronate dehydrogenase
MDMVIGLGQIGQPLFMLLSEEYEVVGRDIEENPRTDEEPVECIHICYGFDDEGHYDGWFVDETVNYIKRYQAQMCIIHSTVIPGTTRKVQEKVPFTDVAYSPVRGRHGQMEEDLRRYSKFVAALHDMSRRAVVGHLSPLFSVRAMRTFEELELAKLLETTYTGLLVAWAQEINRYAEEYDADQETMMRFTDEIEYLPDHAFEPGFIGGHCIPSNIQLLLTMRDSELIWAIRRSNEARLGELKLSGERMERRLWPRRLR